MYKTRAAAASPSEKNSPTVDLRVGQGTPRRMRDQNALPDELPLPARSRRAGSMPPIALTTEQPAGANNVLVLAGRTTAARP